MELQKDKIIREKRRILVVDDDTLLLKNISNVLEEFYLVSQVKSGKQALSFLEKKEKPDLILLDVEMPLMNGYETIQKIREIEGCEQIPVIFLTLLDTVESEVTGLELGAVDYICKPFVKEILLSRIQRHLDIVYQQKNILENKIKEVEETSGKTISFLPEKVKKMEESLSEKQFQVAMLAAEGLSNKEIADKLGYAEGYIKKVLYNCFQKLDIGKRRELREFLTMPEEK